MIYIQRAWGHIVKERTARVHGRGRQRVRKMKMDREQ